MGPIKLIIVYYIFMDLSINKKFNFNKYHLYIHINIDSLNNGKIKNQNTIISKFI